jgi:hypothetical protein
MMRELARFKESVGWTPNGNLKVIGIQIRTGRGTNEGDRVKPDEVPRFFECARKIEARATEWQEIGYHVKWYLTTDSHQVSSFNLWMLARDITHMHR